jgi:hypothetical protein
MRRVTAGLAGVAVSAALAVWAFQAAPGAQSPPEAVVTVDRNASGATHAFKFAHVPSPVTDDAASKGKVTIVDGDLDGNSGAVSAVIDGLLPHDEDEPGANFFFDEGLSGGRFVIDLTRAVTIGQINSYSWHPNTRGPQIYTLYASTGAAPKFDPAPKGGVDPATVGWVKIATVDTRPSGEPGGQYGVSIAAKSGNLGSYRYLLFDCAATEMQDNWGNTFYSEIDVIEAKMVDGARLELATSALRTRRSPS